MHLESQRMQLKCKKESMQFRVPLNKFDIFDYTLGILWKSTNFAFAISTKCPSAGTGRQAWLRAMCPSGREGSIPFLGTDSK